MRKRKFEARNPKQIQNMKCKTTTMFQTGRTEFSVLDFPSLRFNWLRFVSVRGAAFDIRISDFITAVPRREKHRAESIRV